LRAKKLKNVEKIFSVLVCRSGAEASGNVPHYSGFCSKKVRISTKRYRQLEKKVAGVPLQRASQQRHFLTGGVLSKKFELISHKICRAG